MFLFFELVKGDHPLDGRKGGMYFFDRNAPIRSKASLLLEEDIVSNSSYRRLLALNILPL